MAQNIFGGIYNDFALGCWDIIIKCRKFNIQQLFFVIKIPQNYCVCFYKISLNVVIAEWRFFRNAFSHIWHQHFLCLG